jgi:hypothetical protein
MIALADYLRSLYEDHLSGEAVEETSGYGALQGLLNEAGRLLSPRVRAIINTRNRGAGIPDGGMFTADQFSQRSDNRPREGQMPERGAIEVKGLGEDVHTIAKSEQVRRYVEHYGQVLVTNYRQFLLVERDSAGQALEEDFYSLADSSSMFWRVAASARQTTATHEHSLNAIRFS